MFKIIKSLKITYSTEYDSIPVPIVKSAIEYLAKPLLHIDNYSFLSGCFPGKFKVTKIKILI